MKATQFDAIRKAGVEEFAIYPADVEAQLPWSIEHANAAKNLSVRACPTGLVRAAVIETNAPWKQQFTLGCGDTEYARERRNGVLVEIDFDRFLQFASGEWPAARGVHKTLSARQLLSQIGREARTEVVKAGESRAVRMIVSKTAIMAPWNEYALIEAEREKEREAEKERTARLDAVVKALGGGAAGQLRQVSKKWDKKKGECPPDPDQYDYAYTPASGHDTVYVRGEITLPLKQAEQLAALLKKRGSR